MCHEKIVNHEEPEEACDKISERVIRRCNFDQLRHHEIKVRCGRQLGNHVKWVEQDVTMIVRTYLNCNFHITYDYESNRSWKLSDTLKYLDKDLCKINV